MGFLSFACFKVQLMQAPKGAHALHELEIKVMSLRRDMRNEQHKNAVLLRENEGLKTSLATMEENEARARTELPSLQAEEASKRHRVEELVSSTYAQSALPRVAALTTL